MKLSLTTLFMALVIASSVLPVAAAETGKDPSINTVEGALYPGYPVWAQTAMTPKE